MITTRIQEKVINVALEYQLFFEAKAKTHGAIALFSGQAREYDPHSSQTHDKIIALTIEHYPKMTEKLLERLALDISHQFDLLQITLIHRIGRILAGEVIVLILTSAIRRYDAIHANQEAIERLKKSIPFWKKETSARASYWVKPPACD